MIRRCWISDSKSAGTKEKIEMYKFTIPDNVVFGVNAVEKLDRLFPEDVRTLIISGRSAKNNGIVDRIAEILAPRPVAFFCNVEPEPTIQQVDEVRELFCKFNTEAVLAVGGGSALDVGKVVAAAGYSTVPTAKFFYNRVAMPEKGVFMAALPTTAGTGAEVTPNGVFTDKESNIKQSIRGGSILPSLALVDPVLCVECPAEITAASGLDALTQGVESFISRNANNATRAWAMQGVKLIINSIEKAVADGRDIFARSDMSEGTMLGAMAFAVSGLGAVHGLAHPVGAVTHKPHGTVCGMLLPQVLKWNYPACSQELDELALYCGFSAGFELISHIEFLLDKFNIPRKLSGIGLQEKFLPWVVENSRSGSMRANPRDFSDEELTALLLEML